MSEEPPPPTGEPQSPEPPAPAGAEAAGPVGDRAEAPVAGNAPETAPAEIPVDADGSETPVGMIAPEMAPDEGVDGEAPAESPSELAEPERADDRTPEPEDPEEREEPRSSRKSSPAAAVEGGDEETPIAGDDGNAPEPADAPAAAEEPPPSGESSPAEPVEGEGEEPAGAGENGHAPDGEATEASEPGAAPGKPPPGEPPPGEPSPAEAASEPGAESAPGPAPPAEATPADAPPPDESSSSLSSAGVPTAAPPGESAPPEEDAPPATAPGETPPKEAGQAERPTPAGETTVPDSLLAAIEALLFSHGEPVSAAKLAFALEEDPAPIEAALAALEERYAEPATGLRLARVAGGFQLTTRADLREVIERLLAPKREDALSESAVDALSVIAYRQPITVPELNELRGVNSQSVVSTLLRRRLIRSRGRKKVVGRPMLYGTTEEFLERFGLEGLDDLPELGELEPPGMMAPASPTPAPPAPAGESDRPDGDAAGPGLDDRARPESS